MHNSTLTLYGRLRLLVGYLGEKSQENWWSTSFFEPASRVFLEPVFSRTIRLSQYNGVREAARHIHDGYIGVGKVFHLFRLPEEVEQDLQQLIFEAPNEWFTEVSSRDNALKTLRSLAGVVGIPLTEGPQSVGFIEQFYRPLGAKGLAQHYLAAFEQGIRSFPYFTY